MCRAAVSPHLEYGIETWKTFLEKHVVCPESVRQQATAVPWRQESRSHNGRVKCINLSSKEECRFRGDAIKTSTGGSKGFFTQASQDKTQGKSAKIGFRCRLNTRATVFCSGFFGASEVLSAIKVSTPLKHPRLRWGTNYSRYCAVIMRSFAKPFVLLRNNGK